MKIKVKTLMADVANLNGITYPLETLTALVENISDMVKYKKILLSMDPVTTENELFLDTVVGFVTECFIEDLRLCFRISIFRPETGYGDAVRLKIIAICPSIIGEVDENKVKPEGVSIAGLGTYPIDKVAEYYKDSITVESE